MADQATRITSQLRVTFSAFMANLARVMLERLVAKNPVKTTHSQKNWIISTGSRHNGEVGDRVSPDGSVQEQSRRAIHGYDVSMGNIHVGNNVWYMQHLMRGSSYQAEAGWVENQVDTVVEHADLIYRTVAGVQVRRVT